MKRILTLFIMLLVMTGAYARTFVLITGVSSYQNSENNLSQTTKDAKNFKKVMDQMTKDVTILTSQYANRNNILEKMRAIANRAQSGDKIIFFYSGHGTPGSICPYDQLISYDEIIEILQGSSASEKFCFIDACHAGSVVSADNYNLAPDSGIMFFMSSRSDEYSKENSALGAGFFTQGLIKGIRGKADDNGDKNITVNELFRYIYADVVKRSKEQQHPQLIGSKSMINSVVASW